MSEEMAEITPLEELSFPIIAKIYDLASKIKGEIQLSSSLEIFIDMLYPSTLTVHYFGSARPADSPDKLRLANDRFAALDYLVQSGVVVKYTCEGGEPISRSVHEFPRDTGAKIKIYDIDRLDGFIAKIKRIYEEQNQQALTPEITKTDIQISQEPVKKPQGEVIYEITYNDNIGEIYLNKFLFSKVRYNSENETVFAYLFKNPNRKITKKEFKEKTEHSIGKSFHKIVENLGFSGDLRKAFFMVSEQAIFFRNPVTKKDLDNLGIYQLKIDKKFTI